MKVSGINTSESKTYDLVKIFISNDKCPTKEIKCFTLPGIINYNVDKKSYDSFMLDCIELEFFLDPLQAETDHKPGLALILGPGAIGDISEKSPSFSNSHFIDNTYFGPAISGRLPSIDQTVSFRAGLDFYKDSIADENFFL